MSNGWGGAKLPTRLRHCATGLARPRLATVRYGYPGRGGSGSRGAAGPRGTPGVAARDRGVRQVPRGTRAWRPWIAGCGRYRGRGGPGSPCAPGTPGVAARDRGVRQISGGRRASGALAGRAPGGQRRGDQGRRECHVRVQSQAAGFGQGRHFRVDDDD